MKKSKLLVLTLVTSLLFAFTSCGSNTAAIEETAVTFLKAAADADIDTVSSLCTEDVLSDMGLITLDVEINENDFYEGLGIDKSILNEEAQKSVTDFCVYFANNIVQGYSIDEVTEEDGIGIVTGSIRTYSDEALDSLTGNDFQTDLTALMTSYQEEHLEELQSTYLNEGEDAMMIELFNGLLPEVMNMMKTNFDEFTSQDIDFYLEIENVDDKWTVTEGYLVE